MQYMYLFSVYVVITMMEEQTKQLVSTVMVHGPS